jgi:hypothetical protein
MTLRDDFHAATDAIRKVLDEGTAPGGTLRYALGEAERQFDLHFASLVPEVAKVADDVAAVAEVVPVPGAAEVATAADDVAKVADEVEAAPVPDPVEPAVVAEAEAVNTEAEAAVPEVAKVEDAATDEAEGFAEHIESEIRDEANKLLHRDQPPS